MWKLQHARGRHVEQQVVPARDVWTRPVIVAAAWLALCAIERQVAHVLLLTPNQAQLSPGVLLFALVALRCADVIGIDPLGAACAQGVA